MIDRDSHSPYDSGEIRTRITAIAESKADMSRLKAAVRTTIRRLEWWGSADLSVTLLAGLRSCRNAGRYSTSSSW